MRYCLEHVMANINWSLLMALRYSQQVPKTKNKHRAKELRKALFSSFFLFSFFLRMGRLQ